MTRSRRLELAIAAALLVLAAAVAEAVTAGTDSGPADVVRGYYDALAAGDAPSALAYGAIPPGPRRFLTSTVLEDQLRTAAITDIGTTTVRESGGRAVVAVGYRLGARRVQDTVRVHDAGGRWRLDAVAVRTQLRPTGPGPTVLGNPVPAGYVLLFPGAAPVRFAGAVEPAGSDGVRFGELGVPVRAVVTGAATAAVRAALRQRLLGCLAPRNHDPACPLPPGRAVPGTLHGRLVGLDAPRVTVTPRGLLTVTAHALVAAHYRRLTFRNQPVRADAHRLTVHAKAPAAHPGRLTWAS